MRKIYPLVLCVLCLCSLSAYGASPCDSEMGAESNNYQQQYYSNQYSNQSNSYQSPCKKPCQKVQQTPCENPCPVVNPCETTCKPPVQSDCFLCTNKNMSTLFSQMNLSETQLCTAAKIQDKYELEVLSINERIQCEKQNLYVMKQKCSKKSEERKQNRVIRRLEKDRKKICECYEDQFEAILSDQQRRAYRKAKKR